MIVWSLLVMAMAAMALGGCSPGPAEDSDRGSTVHEVGLTVYGAASLEEVLAAIEVRYEQTQPGTNLTIATGSSSALRIQIEQGAPADVFLAADTAQPRALADAGLTDGDPVRFAANELIIIVPRDNPAGIHTPADLARTGVKVIAAGDEVPITGYAQQVIANLATHPAYPPAFADGYAANVVSAEENVKAVVAKVLLGEGDAAIVYRTDALAATNVGTIEIPTEANVLADYAGVVVGSSARRAEAHALLDWLAAPAGQEVLASFGFLAPP